MTNRTINDVARENGYEISTVKHKKMIVVEACGTCFYKNKDWDTLYNIGATYCRRLDKVVHPDTLDPDCPLPDYKDPSQL